MWQSAMPFVFYSLCAANFPGTVRQKHQRACGAIPGSVLPLWARVHCRLFPHPSNEVHGVSATGDATEIGSGARSPAKRYAKRGSS
jgi:hypothetical protein